MTVPDAEAIERLTLPDDPVPEADAVVVDRPSAQLPADGRRDRSGARRAGACAAARWCASPSTSEDLEWADGARRRSTTHARVGDDWAIITRFSSRAPDRYVRDMTTFVRNPDGSWRRDDERHENVMVDTARVPALLAAEGVDAEVRRVVRDGAAPRRVCGRIVGGRRA